MANKETQSSEDDESFFSCRIESHRNIYQKGGKDYFVFIRAVYMPTNPFLKEPPKILLEIYILDTEINTKSGELNTFKFKSKFQCSLKDFDQRVLPYVHTIIGKEEKTEWYLFQRGKAIDLIFDFEDGKNMYFGDIISLSPLSFKEEIKLKRDYDYYMKNRKLPDKKDDRPNEKPCQLPNSTSITVILESPSYKYVPYVGNKFHLSKDETRNNGKLVTEKMLNETMKKIYAFCPLISINDLAFLASKVINYLVQDKRSDYYTEKNSLPIKNKENLYDQHCIIGIMLNETMTEIHRRFSYINSDDLVIFTGKAIAEMKS